MSLSPRLLANRRNARFSTGPKSRAGKARAAKNALRHGLNVPLAWDEGLCGEIDRLAKLIVGKTEDGLHLEGARRIAEAQLDLLRVRQVRLTLFEELAPGAGRRGVAPEERPRLNAFQAGLPRPIETDADAMSLARTHTQAEAEFAFEDSELLLAARLDVLATQLTKLDRYERRALSRRKTAMRAFERQVRTPAP